MLFIKSRILNSFFLSVFIMLFNVGSVVGEFEILELLVMFWVFKGKWNIVEFCIGNL